MAWTRGAIAVATVLAAAPLPAAAVDFSELCAAETARQERAAGIPDKLLTAISLVESGRWNAARRATLAWPWTVTAEGKGRFLPSKSAAIAEVLALKARGVRNIDVGCMQINLLHHPQAFDNLDEAFDPATNVGYAAHFLRSLHRDSGSWTTAATHYHSQTPHLAAAYRAKLMVAWNDLRGTPGAALTLAGGRTAGAPSLKALPPRVIRISEEVARKRAEVAAEREEARRFADQWRRQKLADYHLRRIKRQKGAAD